jgi:hypothetical protein
MRPSASLALSLFLVLSVRGTSVNIPSTSPSSATSIPQDLVAFSIEQDRWPDWIGGDGSPNTFWLNALGNLKELSGKPTRIRIGADSEDHTDFSHDVEVCCPLLPRLIP